ncbi:MAG: bacillopeptidase [Myxococcaceae bacterium]|nr:bacillopeptidase [Myxococcaceae bacterium]
MRGAAAATAYVAPSPIVRHPLPGLRVRVYAASPMRAPSTSVGLPSLALLACAACSGDPAKNAGHAGVVHADAGITDAGVADAVLNREDVSMALEGSARCDVAPVLAGEYPGWIYADVGTATATLPACAGDDGASGSIAWLRTTVAPGMALHVRAAVGAGARAFVRLYAGCGAATCLARSAPAEDIDELWWLNPDPVAREVAYAVGITGPSERRTVAFQHELRAVPSSRTCATAATLPTPTYEAWNYFPEGAETPAPCGAPAQPALWYRVRVPAHTFMTAHGTTADGVPLFRSTLRAFTACGGACLPSRGTYPSLDVEWINDGPATDVVLALSPNEGEGQPVRLAVGFTPALANLACAGAVALGEATALIDQDPTRALAPMPACAGPNLSPALFYRAVIPAGRTLVATARRNFRARPAPTLALLASCDASACLATSTEGGDDGVATLRYANPGAADLPVVIAGAVEAALRGPLTEGPRFALSATTAAPATNRRCAAPVALADGSTLTGQRILDGLDVPRGCAGATAAGPSLYYSVTVGPGAALDMSATDTPAGSDSCRPRLSLLDGCEATACLAESDAAGILHWANPGAAARTLLVALGATASVSADQRVTLVTTSRRPPYRVSPIAAACDDMRTAEPLPLGTDYLGQTAYPRRTLPFAFTFFGEAVSAFTANPGYLTLTTATEERSFTRVVAPLQMSLLFDRNRGMRTRVVDGLFRHVTVEWTDAAPVVAGGGAPSTFQAWLVEGGAVEFHYCSVGPEAGAVASIGIRGGRPPVAIDRPGAAVTGAGLRFTPSGE